MKRYINNNKLYSSKKVKVECECENELKKECTSNIFDFNKISKGEHVKENNLGKLNIFNLEENGKRRKIDIVNIFSELKNSTETNDDLIQNVDKKLFRSKNEIDRKGMNNNINNHIKSKNNYSNEKSNNDITIQKMDNSKTKKSNNQNKYYEKINTLLKEIHLSRIARLNNKNYKYMF